MQEIILEEIPVKGNGKGLEGSQEVCQITCSSCSCEAEREGQEAEWESQNSALPWRFNILVEDLTQNHLSEKSSNSQKRVCLISALLSHWVRTATGSVRYSDILTERWRPNHKMTECIPLPHTSPRLLRNNRGFQLKELEDVGSIKKKKKSL